MALGGVLEARRPRVAMDAPKAMPATRTETRSQAGVGRPRSKPISNQTQPKPNITAAPVVSPNNALRSIVFVRLESRPAIPSRRRAAFGRTSEAPIHIVCLASYRFLYGRAQVVV